MTHKIILAITLLMALTLQTNAQRRNAPTTGIDRKTVVRRNNPTFNSLGADKVFHLGNGHLALTVDATGLQTFTTLHRQGTPLATAADWAWNVDKASQQQWPLCTIGLALDNLTQVQDLKASLDLWTGKVTSSFSYEAVHYDVQTVCDPDADVVATHVKSDGPVAIILTLPKPTGGRTTTGLYLEGKTSQITPVTDSFDDEHCVIGQQVGGTTFFADVAWKGEASLSRRGPNAFVVRCPKGDLQLQVAYSSSVTMQVVEGMPLLANVRPFIDWSLASGVGMAEYWLTGGMVDFSKVTDPRAQQLESRVVNALYRMKVQPAVTVVPQPTDWWRMAQFGLWERPEELENRLGVYRHLEKGPYLIGIAELLYRAKTSPLVRRDSTAFAAAQQNPCAAQVKILEKYGKTVDQAAAFLADSLSADEAAALRPGYRRWALQVAQQWRDRMGRRHEERWDSIIATLPATGVRSVALSSLSDGELLAAVASMLVNKGAGLQSPYGSLPKDWVVRWESIAPMPR